MGDMTPPWFDWLFPAAQLVQAVAEGHGWLAGAIFLLLLLAVWLCLRRR